jgi:hypothetical protein
VHWIGGSNLIVDGIGASLVLLGIGTGFAVEDRFDGGPGALLYAGSFTFTFGSATTHLVHGHPGRAAVSLALHGGATVLAGAYLSSCDCTDREYLRGPALRTIGLFAAVSAVDALLLGWEREPAPPTTAPTWTPTVAPTNGGMTFGVAGSF